LAAGTNAQTVLPFTGLQVPDGVAINTAGNVYVIDGGSDTAPEAYRVVKLAAVNCVFVSQISA